MIVLSVIIGWAYRIDICWEFEYTNDDFTIFDGFYSPTHYYQNVFADWELHNFLTGFRLLASQWKNGNGHDGGEETKKMVENMIVCSVLITLENAIISEEEIHLIHIDWNVGMCEVNIWKLSQSFSENILRFSEWERTICSTVYSFPKEEAEEANTIEFFLFISNKSVCFSFKITNHLFK